MEKGQPGVLKVYLQSFGCKIKMSVVHKKQRKEANGNYGGILKLKFTALVLPLPPALTLSPTGLLGVGISFELKHYF